MLSDAPCQTFPARPNGSLGLHRGVPQSAADASWQSQQLQSGLSAAASVAISTASEAPMHRRLQRRLEAAAHESSYVDVAAPAAADAAAQVQNAVAAHPAALNEASAAAAAAAATAAGLEQPQQQTEATGLPCHVPGPSAAAAAAAGEAPTVSSSNCPPVSTTFWESARGRPNCVQYLKLEATVTVVSTGTLSGHDLNLWAHGAKHAVETASQRYDWQWQQAVQDLNKMCRTLGITYILSEEAFNSDTMRVQLHRTAYCFTEKISKDDLQRLAAANPYDAPAALVQAADLVLQANAVRNVSSIPCEERAKACNSLWHPLYRTLMYTVMGYLRLKHEHPREETFRGIKKVHLSPAAAATMKFDSIDKSSVWDAYYCWLRQNPAELQLVQDLAAKDPEARSRYQQAVQAAEEAREAAAAQERAVNNQRARSRMAAAAKAAYEAAQTDGHGVVTAKFTGNITPDDRELLRQLAQGVRALEHKQVATIQQIYAAAEHTAKQHGLKLLLGAIEPWSNASEAADKPAVKEISTISFTGCNSTQPTHPASAASAAAPAPVVKAAAAGPDGLPSPNDVALTAFVKLNRNAWLTDKETYDQACEQLQPGCRQESQLQLVAGFKWWLLRNGKEAVDASHPLLSAIEPISVPPGVITRPLVRHTGVSELMQQQQLHADAS